VQVACPDAELVPEGHFAQVTWRPRLYRPASHGEQVVAPLVRDVADPAVQLRHLSVRAWGAKVPSGHLRQATLAKAYSPALQSWQRQRLRGELQDSGVVLVLQMCSMIMSMMLTRRGRELQQQGSRAELLTLQTEPSDDDSFPSGHEVQPTDLKVGVYEPGGHRAHAAGQGGARLGANFPGSQLTHAAAPGEGR
jgi:hypothetical protein